MALSEPVADAPKTTAVLVIRGWSDPARRPFRPSHGGAVPRGFIDLLRRTLPGARIIQPDLPMGNFSTVSPDALVQQLLRTLDAEFDRAAFDELIIVAFSAGTLLARSLYATAHGARADASGALDPAAARPWAPLVTRLVLLAGVTRGWSISSATPARLRFFAPLALTALNAFARLRHGRPSFIEQIKRGAPFVVESRLKLQQVEGHLAGDRLAQTVLLLGSTDEFVSPADAMDLGHRDGVSYIEVPRSSHLDILDVASDRPAPSRQPAADDPRPRRAELIRRALTETPAALADVAMAPDDIDDYSDPMDRPVARCDALAPEAVDRVVFVVHGIRDNGFWTKRIAREVKARGRGRTLVVRAPSPSYGFFSMWDFVNPWGRRDATYWFLEKYTEVKLRWPDAPVSFVGHSNGTFLAAHALSICPMVAFERIAFAGSVVRTDYDWFGLGDRVGGVLNLVASADWVVACLPGAFERLGLRRLGVGGAGFQGFAQSFAGSRGPEVRNYCYVAGGHGAGIGEDLWQDLAAYVIDGTVPAQAADDPKRPRARRPWQIQAGRLALLAPLAGLALLGGLVWLLVTGLHGLALAVAAGLLVIIVNNVVRFY